MLIEATDQHFQTLIAGEAPNGFRLPDGNFEAPVTLEMLRQLALSLRPVLCPAAWMMVEDNEIVGLLSIIEVAGQNAVKIGYGVAATRRGRGVCTRAVANLLRQFKHHPHITEIMAETSVTNIASQRVLEHNGFERVGQRMDPEDGELFCWRFRLGPAA